MTTNSEKSARERYVHDFENMPKQNLLGDKLSTTVGVSFAGERVYVGVVRVPRGTGAKAHLHPDETFNYVLQGTLKVEMDGETFFVPKGSLLHIPPGVVHVTTATAEEDAVYVVCRDTTSAVQGKPTTVEV
jgi:quercetin dioxygenase-like cupin family protein